MAGNIDFLQTAFPRSEQKNRIKTDIFLNGRFLLAHLESLWYTYIGLHIPFGLFAIPDLLGAVPSTVFLVHY